MKLVFCSLHGAPGVTTLALVCASSWPMPSPCRLIEADPSGGVLASRYGLETPQPNLMGLAVSARHGLSDDKIGSFCQQLPDEVSTVIAPARGADVRHAMEELPLAELPHGEVDYLVDHGRLLPGLCDYTAGADVVVLVVRPVYEQLNVLLTLAADMVYESLLGVVLFGKGPYHAYEIEDQLEYNCGDRARLLGTLPVDPKGALLVTTEGPLAPLTRRSRLFKAAQTIVNELVELKAVLPQLSPEELLSQEILESLA